MKIIENFSDLNEVVGGRAPETPPGGLTYNHNGDVFDYNPV